MGSRGAPNGWAVGFPSRFARRRPVIAIVRRYREAMAGGEITCGSFQGQDKSGSAVEGVLLAVLPQNEPVVSAILSALDEQDYVLIEEQVAKILLPVLRKYREQLVSEIGHDSWATELAVEEVAGMDPARGKWGESSGWRLYCVADLIQACETSLTEHQPICIAFS